MFHKPKKLVQTSPYICGTSSYNFIHSSKIPPIMKIAYLLQIAPFLVSWIFADCKMLEGSS